MDFDGGMNDLLSQNVGSRKKRMHFRHADSTEPYPKYPETPISGRRRPSSEHSARSCFVRLEQELAKSADAWANPIRPHTLRFSAPSCSTPTYIPAGASEHLVQPTGVRGEPRRTPVDQTQQI